MYKAVLKFTLGLIFVIFSGEAYSQNWPEVGSKWHYTEGYPFYGGERPIEVEAVSDTNFLGKKWIKLIKNKVIDCSKRPKVEFVHMENNILFIYDTNTFAGVSTLYDFNKKVGESWAIEILDYQGVKDTVTVTVDSIGVTRINSNDLKTLFVTYRSKVSGGGRYKSTIIERIGDVKSLFSFEPRGPLCEDSYSRGLRCYEDTFLGLYSTGLAPSCDYEYVWTSVDSPQENKSLISIFPTLVDEGFRVNSRRYNNLQFKIFDTVGKVLKEGEVASGGFIKTIDLGEGIFFIDFLAGGQSLNDRKNFVVR